MRGVSRIACGPQNVPQSSLPVRFLAKSPQYRLKRKVLSRNRFNALTYEIGYLDDLEGFVRSDSG
jgi:hypothetical protein